MIGTARDWLWREGFPTRLETELDMLARRWQDRCITCGPKGRLARSKHSWTRCRVIMRHTEPDFEQPREERRRQRRVAAAGCARLLRKRQVRRPLQSIGVTKERRRRRPAPARKKPPEGRRRAKRKRGRCNSCVPCKTPDCGSCANCLDKPRNGGAYTIRQACVLRQCVALRQGKRKKRRPSALPGGPQQQLPRRAVQRHFPGDVASTEATKTKRKQSRCQRCVFCLAPECGQCKFCRDMLKNGGSARLRKPCLNRRCVLLRPRADDPALAMLALAAMAPTTAIRASAAAAPGSTAPSFPPRGRGIRGGERRGPRRRVLQQRTALRRHRCNKCTACLAPDCGRCRYCLDKPKYGGPSTIRKSCVFKRCQNMIVSGGAGANGGRRGGRGKRARMRRSRCMKCVACCKVDCGRCRPCRDKPKFGGPNLLRQSCRRRRCVMLGRESDLAAAAADGKSAPTWHMSTGEASGTDPSSSPRIGPALPSCPAALRSPHASRAHGGHA